MLGRLAAAAAVIALAGCAGMESAGRNARTPEPTRVAAASPSAVTTPAPAPTPTAPPAAATAPAPAAPTLSAPPSAVAAPSPTPQATAPPSVQAPPLAQPAPQVTASRDRPVAAGDEQVIVPGQRERQVPTPADPRSTAERMQDIRAWDQCVMRVQNAFDSDPMSAQLDVPEDYCARSLGMTNRTSVPESRRQRQR